MTGTVRLASSIVGSLQQGPPLVLLHGLFGNKRNWLNLSKRLNQMTKRRVYALDLRNHGESEHAPTTNYDLMSADVYNFLRQESIDSCVLIGHSMGGRVGMALSLKYPSMVEQLIPVDVTPVAGPFPNLSQYAISAMEELHLEYVTSRTQAASCFASRIREPKIRSFLTTNLVLEDGKWKWRINIEGIADSLPYLDSLPESYFEMKFDNPTLFIVGGSSSYLRMHNTELIYRMFPRAKVATVLRAGHWVHTDQPDEFLTIVKNFVLNENY